MSPDTFNSNQIKSFLKKHDSAKTSVLPSPMVRNKTSWFPTIFSNL